MSEINNGFYHCVEDINVGLRIRLLVKIFLIIGWRKVNIIFSYFIILLVASFSHLR